MAGEVWAIEEAVRPRGDEGVSFLKKLPNAPSKAEEVPASDLMNAIDNACEMAYQRYAKLQKQLVVV